MFGFHRRTAQLQTAVLGKFGIQFENENVNFRSPWCSVDNKLNLFFFRFPF